MVLWHEYEYDNWPDCCSGAVDHRLTLLLRRPTVSIRAGQYFDDGDPLANGTRLFTVECKWQQCQLSC